MLLTCIVALSFWATGPAGAQTAAEKALAESGPLPENAFGSATAPITVIEYASLTCHRCRDFYLGAWQQVKAKYVDTGKIQFVLREYPLNALDAGGFMLARCAGEKKWHAVVDMLYRADDQWAHAKDPLEGLRGLMRQVGMGGDEMNACLADQKLLDGVNTVARRGAVAGVTGTPTFFVNGRKVTGALTIEEFSAMVDPLLEASR
ncbi:thioredoxin domain-containing protein [Methylopila sp. M107]|uniref:thioredoxin domain-containing protein n=1 Tax=Methylopila sp. M107 TaxID=1101190 RepID=UPI000373132C|nr:thioredoxin domain-containing protein [Methylopila sp. M107]